MPLFIVIVWSELLTVVGIALLITGVVLAIRKGARSAVLPLVLAAAAGGFVLGQKDGSRVDWVETSIPVIGEQSNPLASFDHDGFTYAVGDSLPNWIDADGTNHRGGWPDCLQPNPDGDGTQKPRMVQVRVGFLTITDEMTSREVVTIDCRPAG